jgi:hypothetical protein
VTGGAKAGGAVSEKQYRDEIDRLNRQMVTLRKDDAAAKAAANKARSDASAYRAKIKPSTSPTMVRSYENSAKAADKRAEAADKKIAEITRKISDCTKKINTAETNLGKAKQESSRKVEQADARRRRTELDHARRVSQASRTVVHHVHEVVEIPKPKVEELRVLYLTSNPLIDNPDEILRVDAEVARVHRAVRGALHREYLKIDHRPAANPDDLLDGLNDLRPHVVHFSGHGGGGSIVMDNSDVVDPRPIDLTLKQLGRAIGTIDRPPALVVLNACDTVDTVADNLLPVVSVVIAMSDSVSDEASALFAARFYAAIASGLSIKKAFDQAQLAVELGGLEDDSWVITLLQRDDVEPDDIVLVQPPNGMASDDA